MKLLTLFGIIVSFVWLLLFIVLVSLSIDAAGDMELNEWGDFLAGFSAPLALLWLVIGYFQQGKELKLNTEALHAQQEELKRQVEETALLSKNAARQAAAAEQLTEVTKKEQELESLRVAEQAQPEFFARGGGSSSGNKVTTSVENRGGEARDIEIEYDGPYDLTFTASRLWDSGANAKFEIIQNDQPIKYPFRFNVFYTDRYGNRNKTTLEFVANHDVREVAPNKSFESDA